MPLTLMGATMTVKPDCKDFNSVVQWLVEDRYTGRVGLWLALVAFDGVLDEYLLNAVHRGTCSIYTLSDQRFVIEGKTANGWLDRRVLHSVTKFYLAKNGGGFFCESDLKTVDQELAQTPAQFESLTHQTFLRVARTFWERRLPGVLWSHCAGLSRFQLLDRHAWWRRDTQQYSPVHADALALIGISVGNQRPSGNDSIQSIAQELPRIAKRSGSRDAGRKKMIEAIEMALPVARQEGFSHALALVVLKEVISLGGVSGRLLAPSTIGTYNRMTFVHWVQALTTLGMEAEPQDYKLCYDKLIERHQESQKPKSRALLMALHDRLVIRGAALIGGLQWAPYQALPCSQVVWPHEVDLALKFIDEVEGDPRVRSQARLIVLLGNAIPLRTEEYFQLRLVDVFPGGAPTVVIYPRLRDGTHKSSYNRLHQDVTDVRLSDALMVHKRLRVEEECLPFESALPDLRLFGHPNDQENEYAPQNTIDLVSSALRWASGNAWMSVYSLRHTSISRRSRECIEAASSDSDAATWEQNSRLCGHGNVTSTAFYVHDIEFALRSRLDRFLPCSYRALGVPLKNQVASLAGFFSPEPRPEVHIVEPTQRKHLHDLAYADFFDLTNDLATGAPTKLLVAKFNLDDGAIRQLIGLVKVHWNGRSGAVLTTNQDVFVALRSWSTRARHLRQAKYTKVIAYASAMASGENLTAAIAFSHSMRACLVGEHVALDCGYHSARLINHLVNAGYRRSQLIACVNPHCSIPSEMTSSLSPIRQEPRRGRPSIRLMLVDEKVEDFKKASGGSVCTTGLHWLSEILQLWLVSKEVM
jgi:hypothetical protein